MSVKLKGTDRRAPRRGRGQEKGGEFIRETVYCENKFGTSKGLDPLNQSFFSDTMTLQIDDWPIFIIIL